MCGFQRHCGFLRHDVVEPGQEWGREQGCAGRYPREHRPYVFLAQRCRQKLSTMLRQVQLAFSCCLLTELRIRTLCWWKRCRKRLCQLLVSGLRTCHHHSEEAALD